jgi:hypothetical protein
MDPSLNRLNDVFVDMDGRIPSFQPWILLNFDQITKVQHAKQYNF